MIYQRQDTMYPIVHEKNKQILYTKLYKTYPVAQIEEEFWSIMGIMSQRVSNEKRGFSVN